MVNLSDRETLRMQAEARLLSEPEIDVCTCCCNIVSGLPAARTEDVQVLPQLRLGYMYASVCLLDLGWLATWPQAHAA